MRLTTVILIASLMQVSASTLAQKISMERSNANLKTIFREIKSQTGYNFLYTDNLLKNTKPVTIKVNGADLTDVLKEIFNEQPVTYELDNKTVVIKRKEPGFFENIIANFRTIEVRGKILDENGKPLAGATVAIKGKNRSVKTDQNGDFYLDKVGESDKLVISFIGYQNREVDAASDMGSLTMTLGNSELEEVKINAGYYSVTEKERTGNISKITAATISKQPVSNPLMALQNRVTGLQITQQSGTPGGGFKVEIRGRSSINARIGNDPLFIVDGVVFPSTRTASEALNNNIYGVSSSPSPLNMLNPNDIESIEVLKDADATAIYGSRGANGVILINTKKGTTGDLSVQAQISQGISTVDRRLKLMNTAQYLEIREDAFKNDGLTPSEFDVDVNGTWDKNRYTDWQKEIIGGTANSTIASLNLSGGGDRVTYLVGGNYYHEGTVFPAEFGFRRGGFISNVNFNSRNNKLKIASNSTLGYTSSTNPRQDLTSLIRLAPNAPALFDDSGKINWGESFRNPFSAALRTSESQISNLITNLRFSYQLSDELTFQTSLGLNAITGREFSKNPLSSNAPEDNFPSSFRRADFSDNSNNGFIAEPQLDYRKKIGIGKLEALLGGSYQTNNVQQRTITATGFNSDGLMNNIAAAAALSSIVNSTEYKYIGIFARINYNIQSKYLLNLTARRDGSSRFGSDRQFANFGAVGAGWVFSEESFVKNNLSFLNFGKIRGSYGLTGNDQIGDYGYLKLWNTGFNYQGKPTIYPDAAYLGNPDFSWEKNRKLEAALQLGLFRDVLNLEISWYRNRSSNQLIGDPLPLSTGSSVIIANRPAVVQNTGWEFSLNYTPLKNENWTWSASVNLTIPKNKLIAYPGLETSSDAFNYVVGQPLSIKKIYNVRGINTATGLYNIEDFDGNGVFNDDDRQLRRFTGQYFYGGIQNSVRFKGLELGFLFAFTKQNSPLNYTQGTEPPGNFNYYAPDNVNMPTIVLERWRKEGDISRIQKASTDFIPSYYDATTGFGGESISDASYIRLKNVALSYALPNRWLSKAKLRGSSIFIQGQNLLTISNYIGLDPETSRTDYLPPLRTIMVGVNFTL